MSSFQGGTVSGYEGISSYRSYLDLSLDDVEFATGLPNPLYFSERAIDRRDYGRKTTRVPAYGSYVAERENYDLIKNNITTSRFRDFIDAYKMHSYIDSHRQSTIFVPVDSKMKDLFSIVQSTALTPKDIVNFHMLDYILSPVELYDRNLRIQPLLTGQKFLTEGTSIINEHDDRNPNKILQSIKTKSGYMYLIERPLIPYIY
jgi:hypothetical protein